MDHHLWTQHFVAPALPDQAPSPRLRLPSPRLPDLSVVKHGWRWLVMDAARFGRQWIHDGQRWREVRLMVKIWLSTHGSHGFGGDLALIVPWRQCDWHIFWRRHDFYGLAEWGHVRSASAAVQLAVTNWHGSVSVALASTDHLSASNSCSCR